MKIILSVHDEDYSRIVRTKFDINVFFIKVSIQTFDTCDYIYDYIRTEDENKLTELRHVYMIITILMCINLMRKRAKISYQHFDTCDYIYYCIRTEAENILTNIRHAYTLIVFVYTAYMIIICFFFIISIQKCVEA